MKKYLKKSVIISLVLLLSACSQPPARFTQAYNIIENNYVRPISSQTLLNNAIIGMTGKLDKHCAYLSERDLKFLTQLSRGQYAGIGIEVSPDPNGLKVISVEKNSPAQVAGIVNNDVIISANQQLLKNIKFLDRIQLLRGPVDSEVDIDVIQANSKQLTNYKKYKIKRALLNIHTVSAKILNKNIGYIHISFFEKNTAASVQKAVSALEQNQEKSIPIKAWILDLRSNPGGLLYSAADVSNLFLDQSLLKNNPIIVYSKNRQNKIVSRYEAHGKDILNRCPLVILINQGSASGAEIVAACLRDHNRAILIGTKTYGKGSVQSIILLGDNGAIKLTTALYYTPDNKMIDQIGITPDIFIRNVSTKTDNQLSRAVTILEKKY